MTASTESAIRPGWISLHGHRLEWLRDAVLGWMAAHPLPGLEPEVLVVPSNGMAEWFKRSMAQQLGLCAALRVELPSHFLWRCYRAVLGAEAVPRRAALDKPLLVWRLMRLLRDEPERVPVMTADALSRWHLCRQLADLYDQYQIYRPDWLAAWADGQDVLGIAPGRNEPQLLAPDQRWQAQLWRRLLEQLDGDELAALRPEVHQRFVEVLAQPELLADASTLSLPRRVIVFGPSHLPQQQLEALEALSGQVQILLAIPNPCRFHWADLIDGREWLAQVRRRQPLRSGRDPAALSLADAHAEAHPLLVAWGRQGRDFLRLLDAAEDRATAAGREALPRIDLFGVDSVDGADTGPDGSGTPGTLLTQIQEAIRDLRPLSEHPRALGQSQPVDDSVVFQIAHSPLREFEILQDHLLDQLARPGRGGQKLRPRDIIVMVPDIEPCAALIDAVFGAVPRGDARYIPYEIADLGPGRRDPVVVALDWLLGMPQRCTVTELGDLLDVGALARRFGLRPEQRPVLDRWIREAGVRWGLSEPQRADLGLEVCGEINSWVFGLRRMLLGYACGAAPAWRGIEPHDEVAGLEAVAAGGLAELLHALLGWRDQAVAPAALSVWIDRGRALLAQFFVASDEAERLVLVALEQALGRLADESLPAALPSGDDELLPLTVFRAAWLDRLGELDAGRRFIGGGVTFCTLMPMRAIPFDLVCLLGMNEADYPRRAAAADFDLMRLPGQRRPGDRARRDDDRALMLEALLSARQQLLISWVGRSARDSSELPPSVLVAQLRDYLAAGWGETLPQQSTTVHPLQPFSRRYFEPDSGLHTWAREWRPLHEPDSFRVNEASLVLSTTQAPAQTQTPIQTPALTLPQFGAFLTDPLRQFFRARFGLDWESLRSDDPMRHDDEPFEADDAEHRLLSTLWEVPALREQGDLPAALDHLQRCGLLPLGAPGRRLRATLQRQASPMLMAWQQARRQAACSAPRRRVQLDEPLRLHDWIDGLLRPHQGAAESDVSLELCPWTALGRRTSAKSAPSAAARLRPKALIRPWLRGLLAVAEGGPALTAVVIARDARLYCRSPEPEAARHALAQLARLWREVEANALPPPLPLMTAWQWQLSRRSGAEAPEVRPVSREQVESLRRQFEGDGALGFAGERDRSPGWSRCYPDFAALLGVGPDDDLAEALPGSRFDCLSALWLDALIDWIDSGAVEVEPYEGFVAQRDHTAVALSQAGAE
jgi:exodeoxyribonuclease V gamma subunit